MCTPEDISENIVFTSTEFAKHFMQFCRLNYHISAVAVLCYTFFSVTKMRFLIATMYRRVLMKRNLPSSVEPICNH
jgi:hypothetical protein